MLTRSPVLLPWTKMAVLGFSTTLGSRSSSARLTLADLGLLEGRRERRFSFVTCEGRGLTA